MLIILKMILINQKIRILVKLIYIIINFPIKFIQIIKKLILIPNNPHNHPPSAFCSYCSSRVSCLWASTQQCVYKWFKTCKENIIESFSNHFAFQRFIYAEERKIFRVRNTLAIQLTKRTDKMLKMMKKV